MALPTLRTLMVPPLSMGAATVLLAKRLMVPELSRVPAPVSVVAERSTTPFALTVLAVPSVRALLLLERVCVPLAAPTVRLVMSASASSVTVYVPGSVMKTLSPACGARPVFQLAPSLQLPPAVFVQKTSWAIAAADRNRTIRMTGMRSGGCGFMRFPP